MRQDAQRSRPRAPLRNTLSMHSRCELSRVVPAHTQAARPGTRNCVMESVEPAPDGTRYVGRNACLEFWQKLANCRDGAFATEDVVAIDEHAIIRWRYRFGHALSQSVRGVNVMRVRDGLIIEA